MMENQAISLKNLIISNEMAIANLATKVDVINEKCHT